MAFVLFVPLRTAVDGTIVRCHRLGHVGCVRGGRRNVSLEEGRAFKSDQDRYRIEGAVVEVTPRVGIACSADVADVSVGVGVGDGRAQADKEESPTSTCVHSLAYRFTCHDITSSGVQMLMLTPRRFLWNFARLVDSHESRSWADRDAQEASSAWSTRTVKLTSFDRLRRERRTLEITSARHATRDSGCIFCYFDSAL